MTQSPPGSSPPPEDSPPPPRPRLQLPPPKISDADATDPALALADVWDLLDVLPAASASPDMMATTIEMAAVPTAGAASATVPARSRHGASQGGGVARTTTGPSLRQWLPGAALVLGCLVIGIAAGRATVPNPDAAILASLPIVQHVDLLREAGSVAFLEAVAKGGYQPPRRPPAVQSKAAVREDAEEFDAAIAALRADGTRNADRETVARRREQVLRMPDAERRQLERSVETFTRLSGADRSELVAVGRALADPSRGQLLRAARLWHLWVQLRDPADRRDVIELSAEDRLEWLDRATRFGARFEGRMDPRDNGRPPFDREWENRRRPPPDFWRDNHPRPPGPPPSGREPRTPAETPAQPR